MNFFGMGFAEILFVLIVTLIVMGPEKLPVAAKTLGRGFAKIQRLTSSWRTDIEKTLHEQPFYGTAPDDNNKESK